MVFFTQILKVVKARYQCFLALLVFFFNFRQKCITCQNLISVNALLARFLQEFCTDCIGLQECCKECLALKDSCTTYFFCKILARTLQVMYNLSISESFNRNFCCSWDQPVFDAKTTAMRLKGSSFLWIENSKLNHWLKRSNEGYYFALVVDIGENHENWIFGNIEQLTFGHESQKWDFSPKSYNATLKKRIKP